MRLNRMLLQDAFPKLIAYNDNSFSISDKGASLLSSIAFGFFLAGRLIGAWVMKKAPAHKTLGLFALVNVGVCGLIIAKLGWLSVACVFLSYFFMSIMFPTIFALGIFGIGSQSKKKAAAFIVMSITGGALMPKFMGHLGDVYNMSASFWMPLICFALIFAYGFSWAKLSRAEGIQGMKVAGGH
jgi:MFS transporter, FHS family, L-fucose permease